MVLVQKWLYFRLFFLANQAKKMSFTIFQSEKTPFYAVKTTSSKSQKFVIFLKGLTHFFVPKMAIFPTFLFQANSGRKMSFTIFYNEVTPFQAMKRRTLKRRKINSFPERITHGFGSKRPFSNFFFLGNLGDENVFYDILKRRKRVFRYKNKKIKKSKY